MKVIEGGFGKGADGSGKGPKEKFQDALDSAVEVIREANEQWVDGKGFESFLIVITNHDTGPEPSLLCSNFEAPESVYFTLGKVMTTLESF